MSDPGSAADAAAKALAAAGAGHDLEVVVRGELNGASVIGKWVEAYVVSTAAGLLVECWRHSGRDPFKTISAGSLAEAAELAVTHALTAAQRRARERSLP